MKPILTRQVPTAAAITALMLGIALIAHAGDPQNTTNLPATQAGAVATDPYTGLPVSPQAEQWIAPNWKDPWEVLPDISFQGLPLSEIARILREKFKEGFDVLLPGSCDWQNPNAPRIDPSSITLSLQLKNVTATEIFNAMNLVFSSGDTPLRWELKMNGNRPLALLRVVPALLPQAIAPPPGGPAAAPMEKKLMVFFVGDLVKAGGITTAKLFKTLSEVYDMGYSDAQSDLKYHEEAQLIVVNASPDRIEFVRNTLEALEAKQRMSEEKADAAKTKTEAPKKPDPAAKLNK